ncbi:MAG: hypothetical protein HQL30_09920 [Candidatus Omnitrophica bacterium]|nr:hypothetical protein [Candidatus Omnitrophota bacterium]
MDDPVYRALLSGVLCASLSFSSPGAWAAAAEGAELGGYYKDIFTTSRTVSNDKPYVSYLQRARLDLAGKLSDTMSANVIYDHDLLLDDYSRTADFNLVRENNQRSLAFWDTHHVLLDERDIFWTQSLYRAYVRYESPALLCTMGKQDIDWSRMRFYHPFDLFNPVSPMSIEKDETMGVDAVTAELLPADFMSYDLIYAPDIDTDRQSFGLRFSGKIGDYDIFLMGADIRSDAVLGFAFDGYLKDSGLRGEYTYTFMNGRNSDAFIDTGQGDEFTDKRRDERFSRASIGMDRSFTPKLYGVAEYFYNGGAKKIHAPLFFSSVKFNRTAFSVTKHIISTGLEYECTGVTKLNNYLFYDIEESSFCYNPEFVWNIVPNADLTVGCQIFKGGSVSEYGSYHNLFYAEMKLFF